MLGSLSREITLSRMVLRKTKQGQWAEIEIMRNKNEMKRTKHTETPRKGRKKMTTFSVRVGHHQTLEDII